MILEQNKIITNEYPIEYFSMDIDDRDYPHLVWAGIVKQLTHLENQDQIYLIYLTLAALNVLIVA